MALITNQAGTHVLDVDATGAALVTLSGISSLDIGAGDLALNVAQSATHFELSTGNSSGVQLASAGTFTGTIEEIINQQAISLICISNLNGTLTLTQYIDAAGTRISNNWTFPIVGGTPFSKSFTANGNYFRAVFVNNGGTATSTFTLNTYYGTIPASTNLGNLPVSLDEMGGTALTVGQKTRAASIPVVEAAQATYSATLSGAVTAATATDIFTISGSATKTIRVIGFSISGTQTGNGLQSFQLVRRSTASTGGTSSTPAAVPFDSNDPAATAVVRAYTVNPTSIGTVVGAVLGFNKLIPAADFATSDVEPLFISFASKGMKEVTLRGAAQTLALSALSASMAGNNLNLTFVWTEE